MAYSVGCGIDEATLPPPAAVVVDAKRGSAKFMWFTTRFCI